MTDTIVHIAGAPVQVGTHLRQRCSWCGGVLVDQDLAMTAVPVGQDPTYPTWPVGELIEIDGLDESTVSMTSVLEHEDGQAVPDHCCAKLSPEATR